jgi:hypothetical protein
MQLIVVGKRELSQERVNQINNEMTTEWKMSSVELKTSFFGTISRRSTWWIVVVLTRMQKNQFSGVLNEEYIWLQRIAMKKKTTAWKLKNPALLTPESP